VPLLLVVVVAVVVAAAVVAGWGRDMNDRFRTGEGQGYIYGGCNEITEEKPGSLAAATISEERKEARKKHDDDGRKCFSLGR